MTANNLTPHKKTLLLAIDSCDHGALLLPRAIRLAEAMQATLQIVFIEDQPLLKLAALPFVRELSLYSSERRALDVTAVKNAFLRQCDELRRQIDRQMSTSRLQWTLQTTEGRHSDVVLSHLQSADLIAVSGATVTRAPMPRAHATQRADGGIFVSISGDAANVRHAITLARSLSDNARLHLIATPGQSLHLSPDADVYLAGDNAIATLFALLRAHHAELLILPMSHPALQQPADLQQLLEMAPLPLILVRG